MSEEVNSDLVIERKYRDLKLERKIASYVIRRDYTLCDRLNEKIFTQKFYRLFFEVISEKRANLSKHLLQKFVFEKIPDDEKKSCAIFIDKIYTSKIKSMTRENADIIITELRKQYESREIIYAVADVVEDLDNFQLDKSKDGLRKALLIESSIVNVESTGDYLEDFEKRKEKILEFQESPELSTGILTGIRKFDEQSGGIQPGEFGVVIAPSGTGKTMALGNLGTNAWNYYHKNVFFVSCEMTKIQLQHRMDSRLAMVEHQKFRKYTLDNKDMKRWERKINQLKEEHDNFYEIMKMPRHCTPAQIEEEAKRLQDRRKKEIDLIVIDYMNLIAPNKLGKSASQRDWGSQGDAAYDLKNICIDFNSGKGIPIWTANQMTDSYDPKTDMMQVKHMKYSRAIGEVAQIILGLAQTYDDMLEGKLRLEVAKCRDFAKMEPIDLIAQLDFMILSNEKLTFDEMVARNQKIKKIKKGGF